MVFSSLTFLCVFLPVAFVLDALLPSVRARNRLLILVSLLFYAYGEPVYVLLMIASTVVNYAMGRAIGHATSSGRSGRAWLVAALVLNLGALAVFKYADMLVETLNALLGPLGWGVLPQPQIALPVGISFFTFQALSYVIDVWRGEVEPQRSYPAILLYVSFFPQLIAGPIVKYHDIERQIYSRSLDAGEAARGMRRFCVGLAKKVLIANVMASAADVLFAYAPEELNAAAAWVACLAYLMQIYFDFSGYSDMAIGLGHMFGFSFRENFDHPYASVSIKEFWRRWHISLSTWFRDYLYIPLGGNRRGSVRTCLNKCLVFLLCGLWHGASWTFVVWGAIHGVFIMLEEVIDVRRLPRALGRLYTMLVVACAFVIFRADTLGQGIGVLGRMFGGWDFSHASMAVLLPQLTPLFVVTFVVACVACLPVGKTVWARLRPEGRGTATVDGLSYAGAVVLLVACMLSLSGGGYNPFIYFRF